MKVRFNQWNIGGKIIFIATGLAVLSLFMSWVDLGIITASGFQQDGYLLLLLYIYPVYKLLKDRPMKKVVGAILSMLAVISAIGFMLSKSVDFYGTTVNGAGAGLYLFVIASILLTVGVIKYDTVDENIVEVTEV
ncbi:hypothetical protein [Isachenkonia alkalipeptolytica]|uniref:Uncharacterized protein n=1 Tax=Isachenkonia alkalipeptolytica TaxID=2565777 RepID=A0AA43XMS6_9CLOT|nr:hypothetical protein [Isachenkonia alkalipeptolytica]NBG89590.1 hypothetical protein [Isachenkonia alkalipeptolytica]